MKQVVLMAAGAVLLYQVARKNGIHSFGDLRNAVKKLVADLNLGEWLNVEKLKQLVAPVKQELAMS